jgi:hypothetical protein
MWYKEQDLRPVPSFCKEASQHHSQHHLSTYLTMPKWSIESIIALVTLVTTCIPISLLVWRTLKRRQRLAHEERGLYKGSQTHFNSDDGMA